MRSVWKSLIGGRGLLAVLIGAAAIRVAAMLDYGVTYDGDFVDAMWYLDSARRLVETGAFTLRGPQPSALMMPGFVAFMAPVVWLVRDAFTQLLVLKLAMLSLGLLSIYLVYRLGSAIGDRRTGLFAAALLALSPAHIYAGNLTLTENLFQVAVLLFVLLVLRVAEDGTPGRFAACLAVFAAGVYVRETMLLLGLPALVYLWLKGMPPRRFAAYALVTVAVLAAVLTPWWVRNYRLFGEFVPTTTGIGSPFYEGTFQTFHPYGTGSFDGMADVLSRFRGSEPERSRYLSAQARRRLADQWNENPDRVMARYAVSKPAAAWLLPFYWDEVLGISSWWVARLHALVAVLGGVAIASYAFRSPRAAEYRLLLGNVAIITVLAGALLGLSRYVYPFMPFLYVPLAAAAAEVLDRVRPRRESGEHAAAA